MSDFVYLTEAKYPDKVNHPDHYKSETGMEVIDVIEAFTFDLKGIEATDTGNILKYICRWKKKNGLEDLKKAEWYLKHLIDHVEKLEKENGLIAYGSDNILDMSPSTPPIVYEHPILTHNDTRLYIHFHDINRVKDFTQKVKRMFAVYISVSVSDIYDLLETEPEDSYDNLIIESLSDTSSYGYADHTGYTVVFTNIKNLKEKENNNG